jgi:hypothetical protein
VSEFSRWIGASNMKAALRFIVGGNRGNDSRKA